MPFWTSSRVAFHIETPTVFENIKDYLIDTFRLESCFRYNERFDQVS